MKNDSVYGETVTVKEAADILDVSQETVRRWIREGTIPGYRIRKGGWYKIPVKELKKVLKGNVPVEKTP